ncbi:MAG: type II secretion system protein [Actinomycetota bacterium]
MNATAREAGTTLVEVVVAVAILGIAITTIVGGMGTSIIASDHHLKQSQAHTVLVSAVGAVKDATANPYQSCADASTYDPAAGVALPGGWTAAAVAVTGVDHWDGSAFSPSCPAPDGRLQLVTVTVTTPDSRATESVSFVKRDPS